MALASKVQALALALRPALTIFWHHPETEGSTTVIVNLEVIIVN